MSQCQIRVLALALALSLPGCGIGGLDLSDPFGKTTERLGPPGAAMSDAEYAAAREVYSLTNAERQAAGRPLLTWDERAAQVAFEHCADMRLREFVDHENPDGDRAGDRLLADGITYRQAGENIYYRSPPAIPADAVRWWMESGGHRANLLDEYFTHVGVGVHGDGESSWWVQVFFTP